jgi:tetratricopeptide (TPR) repeat protein
MGRFFWNRRTEPDLRKAIGYFERALQADPDYALPYAGLADAHAMFFSYGFDRRAEVLAKAEAAANQALAIDEGLAEAHASLGWIWLARWNVEGAEGAFQRSLELNPAYASAHQWYAELLAIMGRTEQSLSEAERALGLDPLSPIVNRRTGLVAFWAGDYDLAIERFERAFELDPELPETLRDLTWVYWLNGMDAEAAEAYLRQPLPPEVKTLLRSVYQQEGMAGAARKVLELEIARTGKPCTDTPDIPALILAFLGDREAALQCLEEAANGSGVPHMMASPVWDDLRSDPRFAAILKGKGLAD